MCIIENIKLTNKSKRKANNPIEKDSEQRQGYGIKRYKILCTK